MSKKYLIENAQDFGGMILHVDKSDAKQVEVMDDRMIEILEKDLKNGLLTLEGILKAKNLLIVKIIE